MSTNRPKSSTRISRITQRGMRLKMVLNSWREGYFMAVRVSLTSLPLVKPRQSLFQVIENHDLAGGFFMHLPEGFIHPGKTE